MNVFKNEILSSGKRSLRLFVDAMYGFVNDECYLKASALTFYSLLSIVPVLAVLFGIAKGFGFERNLETILNNHFVEQKELTGKLIEFAYSWLESVRGGLIAGIGAITLFWSVFSLLNNVETSLNAIWKTQTERSYIRKISDYLTTMVIGPILLVSSSSMTLYLHIHLAERAKEHLFLEALTPLFAFFLKVSSFLLSWFLFTFIYFFLPNAKVYFRSAIVAGIFAGTTFQLWQWLYFKFQAEATNYGAIYGSFAALPLFLIWLQISWVIFLAGAEIAYVIENNLFTVQRKKIKISLKAAALFVTYRCLEAFNLGNKPLTERDLSKETGLSLHNLQLVLAILNHDKILSTVVNCQENAYQPGRPLEQITLQLVSTSTDHWNTFQAAIEENSIFFKLQDSLEKIERRLEEGEGGQPLYKFCEESNNDFNKNPIEKVSL